MSSAIKLIIFFVTFLLHASTFAKELPQPTIIESNPKEVVSQGNVNVMGKNDEATIKLLELEIQLLKNHQSQLLNTVYWALSGVFLISGLLIGFGWFANFKVYERDKNLMRGALEILIKAELSSKFEELLSETKQTIVKSEKSITDKVNNFTSSVDQRVFDLEFAGQYERMKKESPSMALTAGLTLLELCNPKRLGNL